jgi:hypothetical protein
MYQYHFLTIHVLKFTFPLYQLLSFDQSLKILSFRTQSSLLIPKRPATNPLILPRAPTDVPFIPRKQRAPRPRRSQHTAPEQAQRERRLPTRSVRRIRVERRGEVMQRGDERDRGEVRARDVWRLGGRG